MSKFTITEQERKRILGMHVEATKRHYGLVSEQKKFEINGVQYNTPNLTSDLINKFMSIDGETGGNNVESFKYITKFFNFDPNFIKNAEVGLKSAKYDEGARTTVGGNREASAALNLKRAIVDGLDQILQMGTYIKDANQLSKQIRTYINNSKEYAKVDESSFVNALNKIAEERIKQFNITLPG